MPHCTGQTIPVEWVRRNGEAEKQRSGEVEDRESGEKGCGPGLVLCLPPLDGALDGI